MLKNMLAAAAAVGIVLAPIAAQAGTRSSEASVSLSSISGDAGRIGSPVTEADAAAWGVPLWLILFLLSVGFTLAEILASRGILK